MTRSTNAMAVLAAVFTAGVVQGVTVTINPTVTYQDIDGLGGFGGLVNNCCNPAPYTSQEWVNLMVDTMGLTLLRIEMRPLPDQTTDWNNMIQPVKDIWAKAQASHEPLKVFGTAWTPPGRMKDNGSAIGGGHLLVDSIPAYGTYLVNYVNKFQTDMGFPLYAISPQNEPALGTGYNSCTYMPSELATMVKGVAARFYAAKTPCWIHYADNIPWGGSDWQGQVISSVCQDPIADSIGHIMSIHYDGDDDCFASLRSQAAGTDSYRTVNKNRKSRMWNTEWGGFFDQWNDNLVDETNATPGGAWKCARQLFRLFTFGFNEVTYWGMGDDLAGRAANTCHYALYYRLSDGTVRKGPLFNVYRQFARHIRPGAVRIGCTSSDTTAVKAIAFTHDQQATKTIVLLNMGGTAQTVTIAGTGLPASMNVYQTSSTQNHQLVGTVAPNGTVSLPVQSVTTLYNQPTTAAMPAVPAPRSLRRDAGAGLLCSIDGRLSRDGVSRMGRGVYIVFDRGDANRSGAKARLVSQ